MELAILRFGVLFLGILTCYWTLMAAMSWNEWVKSFDYGWNGIGFTLFISSTAVVFWAFLIISVWAHQVYFATLTVPR